MTLCSDLTMKDVTKKYASNWLSSSWKLRDDESWWQQVLLPYQPKVASKDDDEDQHIEGTSHTFSCIFCGFLIDYLASNFQNIINRDS